MKWLVSRDFLKIFLPVLVTVLVWGLNERSKRVNEEYVRKEERYLELVNSIRGFHAHIEAGDTKAQEAKQTFLDQLNLCWLYCPDEVVEKGYAFLETVKKGAGSTAEERQQAAGEFILALRRDLLNQGLFGGTKLKAKDFKILKVE